MASVERDGASKHVPDPISRPLKVLDVFELKDDLVDDERAGVKNLVAANLERVAKHREQLRVVRAPDVRPEITPCGNRNALYLLSKRLIDVLGALVLLVLLSPILAVSWAVLLITTRGRPLFLQDRLWLCGKPFRCLKFRSMINDAERFQHLVENEQQGPIFKNRHDPRITRVGEFMRRTSIDELPQVLNVLRGEMSLVGPRPPIASEVEEYEDWHRLRLSVKPGLTCFWQVNGRSEIAFEEWMRLDLRYVEQQNLWLDLKLLLRTPWAVLTGRGAC